MMNHDSSVVRQFEELIAQAARKDQVSIGILLDYINDPLSVSPKIWELIDKWVNTAQVKEWLTTQSKEGERREYGIVYDIVHTTDRSGIHRVEVKFISQVGFGGFVYSTTSGSEEINRLQSQEPNGFAKGDLVETTADGDTIVSRKKFVGSKDAELLLRLEILYCAKNLLISLRE